MKADNVKAFLHAERLMIQISRNKPLPQCEYISLSDFILKHGQAFTPAPLPKYVKRGRMRYCYMNSTHLAMVSEPEFIYCEGYALCSGVPLPLMHGWCIDQSGNVVDPTWKDGVEYFGIPIQLNYVKLSIYESKHYGVIADFENGLPILRAPVEKWKITLPLAHAA